MTQRAWRYMKNTAFLVISLFTLFSTQACAANVTEAVSSATTSRVNALSEIREKYRGEDSHFIDLEGVNVHYRDSGNRNGPALLLIHGTLGDAADWDGWVKELESTYRVIRLDLPGFGLSGDIPNGNYSVGRSLNTVDVLMDHLNLETFAVAGISYGGIVAFRYAATRRDRVTAMVLVNSAGIQAGKPAVSATKAREKAKTKAAPTTHARLYST